MEDRLAAAEIFKDRHQLGCDVREQFAAGHERL
jgi:hypothetical protein